MPRALLTLFVLGLGLGGPALAQDDDEIPPGLFAESVEVNVVNVEVRVADRRGRPITGLTKDDFTLYEDGDPVEISYFTEVDELGPKGPVEPVAEPSAPAGSEPLVPLVVTPLTERRSFVIFLDFDYLTPAGMKKTFGDLQELASEVLRPGDRVMVVEHRRNLRVVLDLTSDLEEVRRVLAEAAETAPLGLDQVHERRAVFPAIRRDLELEDDVKSCTPIEAAAAAQTVAELGRWLGAQVEGTISALTSIVRSLGGLPGNKNLLYVGEGLDQRPALEMYYMLGDLCPASQQEIYSHLTEYDLAPAVHRLSAEANSNRVTFYTLHAAGLIAGGDVSISDAYVRLSGVSLRMGEANRKSPLIQMAGETGGRAIVNTNDFSEDLVEISEDVSRYYSLGFVPSHEGDGKIHALKVEVSAPHREVRYRKAFRNKPQPERIVEAMLGALLFGVEENPLGVAVEAGDAMPGADGRYEVPLRIRVPLDSVVLAPGQGFSVGRLRLVMVALEPDGEWTSVRQRDSPFKVTGEEGSAPPRIYEVGMELPAGESVVAIGVRDEQGGDTSYLRLPVTVESGDSATPAPDR